MEILTVSMGAPAGRRMKVAVVGGGMTGLVAAYTAAEGGAEVVLYEKEDYLGGHAKTVSVANTQLDLGFMVFNNVGLLIYILLVSLFLPSVILCSTLLPR